MHTRIANKLDVKNLACPVLHEFQRDLGRELIFHMTPLLLPLPVSECSEAHSRGGQFCSDLRKLRRFTKVAALTKSQKSRNPRFTRAKEKYENQHERQHQGKFPRSEGDNQRGGRKGHGRPQFESRKEDGQSST